MKCVRFCCVCLGRAVGRAHGPRPISLPNSKLPALTVTPMHRRRDRYVLAVSGGATSKMQAPKTPKATRESYYTSGQPLKNASGTTSSPESRPLILTFLSPNCSSRVFVCKPPTVIGQRLHVQPHTTVYLDLVLFSSRTMS